MSVNKVILIGRLGADPELRYTQGGTAVANFNVATNEVWNDKSGKRQEKTEWHRIVVFNKQAETIAKYLKKGKEVFLEGKLQTREWTDKEGGKRYTTEVIVNEFRFIGSKDGGEPSSSTGSANDTDYTQSFNDDDIPF